MKIWLICIGIVLLLFILFQSYTSMAINKTENQAYQLIRIEENFEIRYYPAALMAKINSTSKSYKDLGSTGFRKLAQYIFGGNSANKQIAMTAPVHMEIGDSISSMAFVMPAHFHKDDLPQPNNADIMIETSAPEYVAVLQFGGFANTAIIHKHQAMLETALKLKGIRYHGHFRFLGYNPPYQLFGRRNEVVVALDFDNFGEQESVK
ncbi:MAG: heme-binding protein [Phycisphaerales bacterium]|nr:heme-binding protein [Phycisphaerales bacterium]